MIGDNIKFLRMQNNMTQRELAEKLFVTAQAVSRWENDNVEPSVSTISEMANIFNVTSDRILGIKSVEVEEKVKIEKHVVYTEAKPILGVCEKCNQPIYSSDKIKRSILNDFGQTKEGVFCTTCHENQVVKVRKKKIAKGVSKRKKSFWLGGLSFFVLLCFTLFTAISEKDTSILIPNLLISIMSFTFISCLILDNNFIGDMTSSIFVFGFVRMPGLIFSLDLEGFIWLLTVKLLFWVLGIILAIIFGAIGIILGMIFSIFVYPFAIRNNYRSPEYEL